MTNDKTEVEESEVDIWTLHGPDSVFALVKKIGKYGTGYYLREHINGAPSIEIGSINATCVGRFRTWLERIKSP